MSSLREVPDDLALLFASNTAPLLFSEVTDFLKNLF